jgi:hypothetical protein
MKIRKGYIEFLVFLVVYLFAIYMWTLPFQDNHIPYGEFDAISHWELADSFAQIDRTYVNLPPFVDYSYGTDNRFKPHTLWYHPPFHTSLAMISSVANDRMIPIYLTNAIFASSILISVFFVVRKLFGFLPGILSAFLLTFSMRDIMPYLWGQWPERFGYAFIPLVLYCFYMYYTTYSKEKNKPRYLYTMSFLLVTELMIHPLSFFHSLVGLFVLGLFLSVKLRKVPINMKHIGIALVIFVLLFAIFPYQSGNVITSFSKQSAKEQKYPSLSRLLQWSPNPADFVGSVPTNYFSFREMHGLWTLPFLLLGIVVLFIRRENRDIFLLAWMVSLYFILHRDFIGKSIFLHRSLSASAHIFVPITAIGLLSIPSFLKLKKSLANIVKYVLIVLFVVLALKFSMPQAYSQLDGAYDSPIIRLNSAQIEVSEWLKETISEDQNVSIIGPPPQIMQKVWWMSSYSHRVSHFFEGFLTWNKYKDDPRVEVGHLVEDYILFDYSDIGLLSDRSLANQWLGYEQQNMGNHTLVYNKDDIRVYKYETS